MTSNLGSKEGDESKGGSKDVHDDIKGWRRRRRRGRKDVQGLEVERRKLNEVLFYGIPRYFYTRVGR